MQQCWFISHDRGLDAFLTLQQAVWSSFATENPLTTNWSLRPDRRVTGEQSQKQYDNNDPPLKNSERSNFLGD